MNERNGLPQQPDFVRTEPTVFDFRNPSLSFETGTRITGMQTWEDVTGVFNKLIKGIARDSEADKKTQIHIINYPNLETHTKTQDRTYGFHGQSSGFEIEITPTDLSFVKPGRKTEPDPKLAKTFVLSRHIHSGTLSGKKDSASSACTVSLVDKGVYLYKNNYGDGLDRKHNFGASLSLKPVDETALRTIKGSKGTPASVTARRQSPIQMRRGRF